MQAQLRLIREAAERAENAPELEALVQVVTVPEDRAGSAAELSEHVAHGGFAPVAPEANGRGRRRLRLVR